MLIGVTEYYKTRKAQSMAQESVSHKWRWRNVCIGGSINGCVPSSYVISQPSVLGPCQKKNPELDGYCSYAMWPYLPSYSKVLN